MKHKTPSEENSQSQYTVDGPGSQLRKARERLGLDQAKVAAQLHLSQPLIHALEWDDYDKLPAAVFVQGYLRNYARLLGVDEEAIILTYQTLHPDAEQQPLPRNQPDEVALELHNDYRLVRYVTWGVLLILGVVIFFWWQGRLDSEGPPAASATDPEVIEPDFSTGQGGLNLPREEELAPVSGPATETVPDTIDVPPVPAPDASVSPPPAAGSSLSVEVPLEEAPSESPQPPVESLTATPAPAEETEPAAPVVAGQVLFEFLGPCWVEVRDAGGRARILGVMRQGARRSLAAAYGPFRIVIGDIHTVRLSVNGEPYDLQPHARGKVARFTLDPSLL